MIYALLLNDMRQPNIENIQIVRTAETDQELITWHHVQIADEPWFDGRWRKTYKPGSTLEWFNPASDVNPWDLSRRNDFWGGIWEVPDGTPVGAGLAKAHPRIGLQDPPCRCPA